MTQPRHWSLGAKLALVGTPFLLMALALIAITLWVSWQLEGGAAAVNETGRMRMQTYRMSLSIGTSQFERLPQQAAEFRQSLELLRNGDPERPLFVPWDETVRNRFATVEHDWGRFQERWIFASPASVAALRSDAATFVEHIAAGADTPTDTLALAHKSAPFRDGDAPADSKQRQTHVAEHAAKELSAMYRLFHRFTSFLVKTVITFSVGSRT